MAIWDNLLKRLVSPVIDEEINKYKKDQLAKGLELYSSRAYGSPIETGVGDAATRVFQGSVRYDTLREFATYYPILRACVNYRKRQIARLAWGIGPVEVITDKKKKEKIEKDAKEVKDFFKYPTGDKTVSFSSFINRIVEDLQVLDAVAIYKRKNRRGGFFGYLNVDGATIELILNEDGTTPLPPNHAYQQKMNGEVVAEMTVDELVYKMINPRTTTPYGLSPVETLILTVTTALKLGSYNLAYLTEGNVPEGFVELPKDIASDPDQLKVWQTNWDSMFAGDPRYQRKIKFLPEGMNWHPIKKQEDIQFERFEKWLLLQTCSVMEVAPQSIGFQFERGKGATEAEWEIGKERGLYPLAQFLKEIFDEMIKTDLGHPELQFVWSNLDPTDRKEEAEVFGQLVRTGALSVDEFRIKEGYEPIGLEHYIMTPVGPIFAKDFITMSDAGATPFIPESVRPADVPGYENVPQPKEPPPKDVTNKIKRATSDDIVRELKRWKKAASNDLKQGREFREFTTDVIDYRTQNLIKEGLNNVRTKKDLDDLFSPFISQENKVIAAMLDLYDEVSELNYGSKKSKTG